MAFACALILGLVLFGTSRSPLVGVLSSRPLVWLGTVSYSIFLWHHPLIGSLREHGLSFDGRLGFLLNLSITLLLTVILSALTYRLVESPALVLKRGSPRTVDVSPAPRTTA
jgi:peptidoglycan/LPS O-acetylase OafA/YrhL